MISKSRPLEEDEIIAALESYISRDPAPSMAPLPILGFKAPDGTEIWLEDILSLIKQYKEKLGKYIPKDRFSLYQRLSYCMGKRDTMEKFKKKVTDKAMKVQPRLIYLSEFYAIYNEIEEEN